MRARGSSFLRIEILFAILAVPLLTGGCGPRLVWGLPVEDLRARLRKADYSVLAGVDFQSQDLAQAVSLSPEAPFYLSFIFGILGKQDMELGMLELAWERSPRPWKEEAGALLAQAYIRKKDYPRAVEVGRSLLSMKVSREIEQHARRMLAEALYWNRDDAEALREAERIEQPDPETLLFRAVSSIRLGLDSGRELMMRLFVSERVSSLHGRAYPFLTAEPRYMELFSDVERDLLAAKYRLQQGDWVKGIPLMEGVLRRIEPARISDGALVADLGNSYLYARRYSDGARYMETIASRLPGQARLDALEWGGKLARRAREYGKALALFRAVSSEATSAVQGDRARWFILDILITQDPPDLPAQIQRESAAWSVPSYFSDLLEERIAGLAATGKWKELAGFWRALAEHGPDRTIAQLAYILARARQEGLLPRLPGSPPASARDFFRAALEKDPAGYYGVMSAGFLGELPAQNGQTTQNGPEAGQNGLQDGKNDPSAGQNGEKESAATPDPVALGFLAFGLTDQAYARIWDARDSLMDQGILQAARLFSEVEDHRSSMYMMAALSRRRRLAQQELSLLYPRPFRQLIDSLAESAGLPDYSLYAIIREESFFDADIVSSAGAVGLSQLMPETAAQVARGLHLENPDLKDPATNLTIGVRHLQDLLSSVDSLPKALLAYNAGLTRVRTWEKTNGRLPLDLFLETVSLEEPRQYIRKILVTTVMYALQYRNMNPREVIMPFFKIAERPLDEDKGGFPAGAASPR